MIKAYGRQRLQEITAHNQKRIAKRAAKKAASQAEEAEKEKRSLLQPVQTMVASSTDLLKQVIQFGRKQNRSVEDVNYSEDNICGVEKGSFFDDNGYGQEHTEPVQNHKEAESLLQRVLQFGQQTRQQANKNVSAEESDSSGEQNIRERKSDSGGLRARKSRKRHVKWPVLKPKSDERNYKEIPAEEEQHSETTYSESGDADGEVDEASPICRSITQSLSSDEETVPPFDVGLVPSTPLPLKPMSAHSESKKKRDKTHLTKPSSGSTRWSRLRGVSTPPVEQPTEKGLSRLKRTLMRNREPERSERVNTIASSKAVSFDNPMFAEPPEETSLRKVRSDQIYDPSSEPTKGSNSSFHHYIGMASSPSTLKANKKTVSMQSNQSLVNMQIAENIQSSSNADSTRERGYNSLPRF